MKAISKALSSVLFLILAAVELTSASQLGADEAANRHLTAAVYAMIGLWLVGAGANVLPMRQALPWLACALFSTFAYGLTLVTMGNLHGLVFAGAAALQSALNVYGYSERTAAEEKVPLPPEEEEIEKRHAA